MRCPLKAVNHTMATGLSRRSPIAPRHAKTDLIVFLNSRLVVAAVTNSQALQPDNDLGRWRVPIGVSVADVNADGLPDLLFSCLAPGANAFAGAR